MKKMTKMCELFIGYFKDVEGFELDVAALLSQHVHH